MWICDRCGAWLEATALTPTPAGTTILCPNCGYSEPFVQDPLWWITGSSGAGKSGVIPHLRRALPECVVFDGEAIDFWRFAGEAGDYAPLYDQWLKVGHQLALNRRPLVIVATALPAQLDACPCRAYFSTIHYLGLVCPAAEQERRLRARPAWRQADGAAFIANACGFTRRLGEIARADPAALTLHDTTAITPVESALVIARWVRQGIQPTATAVAGPKP